MVLDSWLYSYFRPVNLHPIYYDVSDLPQLLDRLGKRYSAVFALVDAGIPAEATKAFLGDLPLANVHVLPGGEGVKTWASIEQIWNFLLQAKTDRQALLVNLGGGAVCDAGGFAASTFKRGIDFVHIPGTLLSMVDASVGGKTGINLGGVKNVVGTFTQPRAVCIHTPLLQSLPKRQLLSGYAEMIKHGLVADELHLQNVLHAFWEEEGGIPPTQLIRDSINIKAAIVERDPLESGERKLLNFGHTVGHALESYFADQPGKEVLHGEAVAAGMLAEMYISVHSVWAQGVSQDVYGETQQTLGLIGQAALPVEEWMFPALIEKMGNDKKNEGARIGMTLLETFGRGIWGQTVSVELLKEALVNLRKYYLKP